MRWTMVNKRLGWTMLDKMNYIVYMLYEMWFTSVYKCNKDGVIAK